MSERLTEPQIQALDLALEIQAEPAHAATNLKFGSTSPGRVVVAGVDGHLFIGDGANRWEQRFLTEVAVVQTWLDQWAALLVERQAEAARRRVTLVNFVAPEKQVLLGEKRWPDTTGLGERRPLRQLIEAVGPSAIVYPDRQIAAIKSVAPMFYRYNSHWTPSGCIAAARALWAALGVEIPPDLTFAVERRRTHHDLPVHFFRQPPMEEIAVLVASGTVVDDNRADLAGRNTGSTYRVLNSAAPDRRKLVLFGDSYASDAGLTLAMSAMFAEVLFVWSKSVQWDLVSSYAAELVVWESAERFLVGVPEA